MREKVYVLSHGNYWKMACEHCKPDKVTVTQAHAIALARQHVAGLPAGTLSQILVQNSDGRFRAEWTYGADPYPPRG